MEHPFTQVDVFTAESYQGNPLAVVLDAESVSDDDMQRFARWTNLSETTFVLPPNDPAADYRVRIFTPGMELPFAGHPTLGTAHAWIEAGGKPKTSGTIVQECGVGLVNVRQLDGRLAFEAPPLIRSGPLSDDDLNEVADALGIEPSVMLATAWIDNGPGWVGIQVGSVAELLAISPKPTDMKLGVFALTDDDTEAAIEVRGFFPESGTVSEDPVTGSLNASLAQWLLGNGTLRSPYLASQGQMLGRSGRVYISQESPAAGSDGAIWVAGDVVTCIRGSVRIP